LLRKAKQRGEGSRRSAILKNQVKVKICGITNLEDALCAQEAGADYLGFVFAESPRRITVENAKIILQELSKDVKVAALFVNEGKEVIDNIVGNLDRVDLLQFHGDETPEFCMQFKPQKIIKAIRVKDEESIKQIQDFNGVDFILLDAYTDKAYGGTGRGFDRALASKAKEFGLPLFLSGGLNPENVIEAVIKVNPFCVDVSSGVEKTPGKKDHALVKKFIKNAKIYNDAS
jgi:phosphoribosylanthranilate isomerase